jgi:NCS1 family nucleobase:cation symporter-1
VPWKILASAQTFLNFMGGYAVFLAPIAGILASDYWLVKKQHVDVPALYNPDGRYSYKYGTNWRAVLAMLIAVLPNLPGLAKSINANTKITTGAEHLYTFDWLYGFVSSVVIYTATSLIMPAKETLVDHTIYGDIVDETIVSDDAESASGAEKTYGDVKTKEVPEKSLEM